MIKLFPDERQLVELDTAPLGDEPTAIDTVRFFTDDVTVATVAPVAGNPRQTWVQSAGLTAEGTTMLNAEVDVRRGPDVVTIPVIALAVTVAPAEAETGEMTVLGVPEKIPAPPPDTGAAPTA